MCRKIGDQTKGHCEMTKNVFKWTPQINRKGNKDYFTCWRFMLWILICASLIFIPSHHFRVVWLTVNELPSFRCVFYKVLILCGAAHHSMQKIWRDTMIQPARWSVGINYRWWSRDHFYKSTKLFVSLGVKVCKSWSQA